MKKLLLILGMIVFTFSMNAQYRNKEYSKSVALYKAKEFVMMEVIGVEEKKQVKFDIDPLAAATSGELTSLTYSCDEKNLKGFVLGFYGNYWNEAGVLYKGYVNDIIYQLQGGLRSSMGYIGAKKIKEIKKKAKFIKITKAGFYESMVHSVEMTDNGVNYKL